MHIHGFTMLSVDRLCSFVYSYPTNDPTVGNRLISKYAPYLTVHSPVVCNLLVYIQLHEKAQMSMTTTICYVIIQKN